MYQTGNNFTDTVIENTRKVTEQPDMTLFYIIVFVVIFIIVLNVVLFFKIWAMTDNVKDIAVDLKLLTNREHPKAVKAVKNDDQQLPPKL